MDADTKKSIIGLLGGIASGKSTVAKELALRNCAVIDADTIAANLLRNTDIKARLREAFGADIFDSAGNVDKKKLAEAAFEKKNFVERLNSIIHPAVHEKIELLIKQYNGQKDVKAIVLDIPLLAETGWEKRCDKLIFVRCGREIRLKRIRKKQNFDENQLKKRENFQISLDRKEEIAHYILRNEAGYTELVRQIDKLFPILIE